LTAQPSPSIDRGWSGRALDTSLCGGSSSSA